MLTQRQCLRRKQTNFATVAVSMDEPVLKSTCKHPKDQNSFATQLFACIAKIGRVTGKPCTPGNQAALTTSAVEHDSLPA